MVTAEAVTGANTGTAEFPNRTAFTVSAEILAQYPAPVEFAQPVAFEKNIIYANSHDYPAQKTMIEEAN